MIRKKKKEGIIMKKQFAFLRRFTALMLALCMLTALTAEIFAADIVASGYCGGEDDGTNLSWTLDSKGTLIIRGTGRMEDYGSDQYGPWPRDKVKNVTIESGVTSIGAYAFTFCGELSSITIPISVTSIGDGSFIECFSLTSISIPSSVTNIGAWAFYFCSLTSVSIPNGVASIGDWTFAGCLMTSIVIPNSVTSIGECAFSDCSSLTSITIPKSVSSIGDYTFSGCSSLTSITIPSSVTSIGESAFERCGSLTSITIPNSVTSIGRYAFSYCRSLTSITIPKSVSSIGENAFIECSSLTSITIPNSVTSIGAGTFNRCGNLTSITIPNSITVIGKYAFGNCGSLTSITIPRSVTSIDEYAFNGCSNLESVYFRGNAPSVSKVSTIFDRCKSTLCIYYMPGTTGWTDGSAYDVEKGTWNGYPLKKMGTDTGNGANGMNGAVSAAYLKEIAPNGVCVTALQTAALKFNTAVRPGSGMISVYSVGDKQNPVYSVSVRDSSVSCSGQTVKIDFSKAGAFEDGEYFIKIDPASFQSENGRYFYGLTDETAWTLDIQRYTPASDIDLKWEKKGIWPFRRDDYSKPPIPAAGTDRQYAQALVNWAQSVGITWMSVDEAERLLDKPAYLPVTDRYGSTVLLNDSQTGHQGYRICRKSADIHRQAGYRDRSV